MVFFSYRRCFTTLGCLAVLAPSFMSYAQPEDVAQDPVLTVSDHQSESEFSSTEPAAKWKQLTNLVIEIQSEVDKKPFEPVQVLRKFYYLENLLEEQFSEIHYRHKIFRILLDILNSLEDVYGSGYQRSYPGFLNSRCELLRFEIEKAAQLSLLPVVHQADLKIQKKMVDRIGSFLTMDEISDLLQTNESSSALWNDLKKERLVTQENTRVSIREVFLRSDLLLSTELAKMIQIGKGVSSWKQAANLWDKELDRRILPLWMFTDSPKVPLLALCGSKRVKLVHDERGNTEKTKISLEEEREKIASELSSVSDLLGVHLHSFTTHEPDESHIRRKTVHQFWYDLSKNRISVYHNWLPFTGEAVSHQPIKQWAAIGSSLGLFGLAGALTGTVVTGPPLLGIYATGCIPIVYLAHCIPEKMIEVPCLMFDRVLFVCRSSTDLKRFISAYKVERGDLSEITAIQAPMPEL